MKTQVIQLNLNEDYISVREKMSWCQADRILLVWPENGQVLNRPLELNLIRRHAANLGVQLWLVSNDKEVQFYAHMLGINLVGSPWNAESIPNHESLLQQGLAEDKKTHTHLVRLRQELHPSAPDSPVQPVVKVLCLSMCALALFALAIWILPGAKITLAAQAEQQSMVFELVADPTAKFINYSTGAVPAYFQEVIVTAHDSIKTTGTVTIPDRRAVGNLRFTNNTDQSVTIPAGIKVSTSGVDPIFYIMSSSKDVDLPPQSSIFLEAQAMNPGSSGNLPADQLIVLSADLGSGLTVTNPQATTGGTDVELPSPSEQDVGSLHRQLINNVVIGSLPVLRSVIPSGDILITPTITTVETLDVSQFPAVGDPGSQLELSMRVRMRSQVVSSDILQGFCNPIMDSYTPPGYLSLPGSLTYKDSKITGVNSEGNYHLSLVATRTIQASVPVQRILNMIRGKPVSRSLTDLSASMPMASQTHIQVFPRWWPWLPFLTFRIELEQAVLK